MNSGNPPTHPPASASPIRVLLVDDHEVVRVGIRTLITRDPGIAVVAEAGNVKDAVAAVSEHLPQVVLLDIRLPGGSGFDGCRQMLKEHPSVRVMVLSSYADSETVMKAIASGASGYLLKEVDGEGLVKSIKNVAAGGSVLDPNVTHLVLGRIKSGDGSQENNKLSSLSAQERRVIALVAEGKTNKEIATAMGLSDKTIKNYFSNILDKLGMSRRSQAAAFYVQNTSALERYSTPLR